MASFPFLNIAAYTSIFGANVGQWRRVLDDQIAGKVNSYRHTTDALGGFISAEFTMPVNYPAANEWLDTGLMRHIEVKGPFSVWEGFVNEIEITYGNGLSVRRGPAIEVDNKVMVEYMTISIDVTPPIPSYPASTAWAENTDSQGVFGVLQAVLSGGENTPEVAEQGRDSHLAEYAWPNSGPENLSVPISGGTIELRVSCRGYRDYLERYIYNQTTSSGEVTASAKLEAILLVDPNTLFTYDNTIGVNSLAVPAYEDSNSTAWSVIKDIASIGDSGNNRWLFGIYESFTAVYQQAGSTLFYQMRMQGNSPTLLDSSGSIVNPWYVRPGHWLALIDLIPDKSLPYTATRQDPRMVFIESVTYTAPYQLDITATKFTRGRQQLIRLGFESM